MQFKKTLLIFNLFLLRNVCLVEGDCNSVIPDCSVFQNGHHIRDTAICNKYYICSNGEAITSYCGEGMSFDTDALVCNYASLVDCVNCVDQQQSTNPVEGSSTIVTDPMTDSTEASTSFATSEDPVTDSSSTSDAPTSSSSGSCQSSVPDCTQYPNGAYVRDSMECNKYYICQGDRAVENYCANGMYFDTDALVCNYASLVDCVNCVDQQQSTNPVEGSSTIVTDPMTDSTVASTSFATSEDPVTDSSSTSDAPTSSSSGSCQSSVPDCSQYPNGAYVRDSMECNKYYICQGDRAVENYCANGMYFDTDALVCNYASLVDCVNCVDQQQSTNPVEGSSTIVTDPMTDSTEASTSFATSEDPVTDSSSTSDAPTSSSSGSCQSSVPDCTQYPNGAYVRDSMECNKYYICHGDRAVENYCANGMYFDTDALVCNYASLVDCVNCVDQQQSTNPVEGSSTIVTDLMTDSTEASTSFATSEDPVTDSSSTSDAPTSSSSGSCQSSVPDCSQYPNGAYVRDSMECNKYYICQGDRAVENYCANGMYFDTDALVCNYASLVDCVNCVDQQQSTNPVEGSSTIVTDPMTDSTVASTSFATSEDPVTDSSSTSDAPTSSTSGSCQSSVPDCSQYPNGAYVRDSMECNKYYICQGDRAVENYCANGMYFDTDALVCNYASLVDCVNCVDQQQSTNPVEGSSTIVTDPMTDSTVASTSFATSEDPVTDSSSTSDAPTSSSSGSCQSSVPDCSQYPNGAYVRDSMECNKYYICQGDRAVENYCANGMYFDTDALVCNYASLVDCVSCKDQLTSENPVTEADSTTSSEGQTTDISTESSLSTSCQEKTTETSYYTSTRPCQSETTETSLATTSTVSCEETTASASSTACHNSQTDSPTTTPSGNVCRSEVPDCSQYPNGAFVRDSSDCNKYYICQGDRAVENYCANGMYFDTDDFVCNFAYLVDCKSCKDQLTSENPVTEADSTTSSEGQTTDISTESSLSTSCQEKTTETSYYTSTRPCQSETTETSLATTSTISCEETTSSASSTACHNSQTDSPTTTPSGNVCQSIVPDCSQYPNGAFVRDSSDCNKYYVCRDWEAVKLSCGSGMYFDDNAFVCNFAYLVDCVGCNDQLTSKKPVTVADSTTPNEGQATDISTESSLSTSCQEKTTETSYYTSTRPCQSETTETSLATTSTISCEETTSSASSTACHNSQTDSPTTTPSGNVCQSVVPDCSQYPNGAFVRDSSDCNKYYVCRDWEAVKLSCGSGMYFDDNAFVCNFAYLVDCVSCNDQLTSKKPVTVADSTTPNEGQTTDISTESSLSTSCQEKTTETSYYTSTRPCQSETTETSLATTSTISCEETTSSASSTACHNSQTDSPTTTPSGNVCQSIVPDCSQYPNGAFVRDSSDCNKYYVCRDWEAVKLSCGSGMYFDDNAFVCNFAYLVDCVSCKDQLTSENPVTEADSTTPSERQTTDISTESSLSTSCQEKTTETSYYTSTRPCQSETTETSLATTSTISCEETTSSASSTACHNSQTDSPTTTPSGNVCQSVVPDCSQYPNGAFVRDSSDCNKYYVCRDWEAVKLSCGSGMYFDDNAFVCNFAYLVDCVGCNDQLTSKKPVTVADSTTPNEGQATDISTESSLSTSCQEKTTETSYYTSTRPCQSETTETSLATTSTVSCEETTSSASSTACHNSQTDSPTTTPSGNVCQSVVPDCSQYPNGAFVRDSSDCNKYYVCRDWEAVKLSCGSGMYFDDNAFVCNFAYLVDCVSCKDQLTSENPVTEADSTTPSEGQTTDISTESSLSTSCQEKTTETSYYTSTRPCQSETTQTSLATTSTVSCEETTSSASSTACHNSQTDSPTTTPSGNVCQSVVPDCSQYPNGAFVRDSSDCNKYYVCRDWEAVKLSCGSGMYFDDNAFVCNFAYLVDCVSCNDQLTSKKPVTVADSTTPNEGQATDISTESSLSTSCQEKTTETSYYTSTRPCQSETTETSLATTSTVSCEETTSSASSTACHNSQTDSPTTTPSGNVCQSVVPDCSQYPNGAFVRDSSDCNKYYVCRDWEAVKLSCGSGMYFDDNAFVCNFAYLVDCVSCNDQLTSKKPVTVADSTTPNEGQATDISTESSLSTSCQEKTTETSYYTSTRPCQSETTETSLATTSTISCEETTSSASSTACHNSQTDSPTTTPSGNVCQSEVPDCSQYPNGAFVRDSSDCNKYYVCRGWEAVKLSCGRGMFFDIESFVCNYSWLVKCETCDQSITSTSIPTDTQKCSYTQATTPKPSTAPTTRAPCSTEIISAKTTTTTLTTASCQKVTTSAPPKITAPNCRRLRNGAFVRDSVNCNKYYVCSNGRAVAQYCARGLFFDEKLFVCNYASLVDC